MAVLVVRNLTHSFGGFPVLDEASLRVERGDRVCLFGRNGEGKSTLLRIINGELRPDGGGIDLDKGARVAALEQEVPEATEGTIFDVVAGALGDVAEKVVAYHHAVDRVAATPDEASLAALDRAHAALDAADGWDIQLRVETILSRLGLDPDAPFGTLSGGWRRRVFLARALALQPDVLLLDEPTNHLDIAAIEWLENFLQTYDGALLFVTHDRAFLRNVATRIVELDRGKLTEFPADFDAYLEAKAHALEVEATHDALFDKKLAQEEAWIRTGIKARRTRNEGRVRALEKLRQERKQRRNRKGAASIAIQAAERSGEIVARAEHARFAYPGGEPLIRDLTLTLKRGDKLGMIGPNGAGKTTLLKLLLGDLEPTAGAVEHGTRLQVRYYDQLRDQLSEDRTVAETIAPDGDMVVVGDRSRHVISYLREFLFDDAQARVPVSVLSGGERNRLLLAKLFAEPANVLVLDEPTNDLDIETLEVLEDRLNAFDGAVILVSHDREFLDNVVTQSLIFEGEGVITSVVGGYDEWDRLRDQRAAAARAAQRAVAPKPAAAPKAEAPKRAPNNLTYAERLELEALPAKLEELEASQSRLHEQLADPSVYADPEKLTRVTAELAALDAELQAAYARWEDLESRS